MLLRRLPLFWLWLGSVLVIMAAAHAPDRLVGTLSYPEVSDTMSAALQIDRDLVGMLIFQYPSGSQFDEAIIDVLKKILSPLRDEIGTLRMVRETFLRRMGIEDDSFRYLRLTAADAVGSAALKLADSKNHKRDVMRVMRALLMYAQPEIKNPLQDNDNLWKRRKDEIARLQNKILTISQRLQQLAIV